MADKDENCFELKLNATAVKALEEKHYDEAFKKAIDVLRKEMLKEAERGKFEYCLSYDHFDDIMARNIEELNPNMDESDAESFGPNNADENNYLRDRIERALQKENLIIKEVRSDGGWPKGLILSWAEGQTYSQIIA